ncbi:MAG TPA: phosphoribosylaminoimidazolesuccinocarboxamide synthase [Chloroflexota bacterium]|jgi:phosphoribosylaminoimidazole-succinocarboxamide synthase
MAREAQPVLRTDLPGLQVVARGKVRDVYRCDGLLLLVATDRVSAFDVVLPAPIPEKGRVLTELSAYWFYKLHGLVPNHLVSTAVDEFPPAARPYTDVLAGRTMLCRPAERIAVECVARGYLTGSAWSEYTNYGTVGGVHCPAGMRANQRFAEPVFTQTTKEDNGHDLKLTYPELVARVGSDTAATLRDTTLRLYGAASAIAAQRGIIIADTKLEFGWIDNQLTWIDEAFTPDSSRFWAEEDYALDIAIASYDKQPLRDYLSGSGWNLEPPAPELPAEVVQQTSRRYLDILERLMSADATA